MELTGLTELYSDPICHLMCISRYCMPEELEWREFFEKQQAKADYLEEYPESVEEGYS